MAIVIAVVLLACGFLFHQAGRDDPSVPSAATAPSTDEPSRPPRAVPRNRVEPVEASPDEPVDLSPAVAVGEDGRLLVGSPPPYESADPNVDYHYVVILSATGDEELGTVRPDHEGRFVLPGPLRGVDVQLVAMTVRAAIARPHPRKTTWDRIAGGSVEFVEPRVTGQVNIRCVDDTGVPVDGRIELQRGSGHEWRTIEKLSLGADGVASRYVTGAGGYRVRLLEAGNRSKRFRHPPARRFDVVDGTPIDVEFSLPRAAEIVVRVTDEQGRPLPGVSVGVLVHESGQLRPHPEGRWTEGDGSVRLRGIEPGDVVLQASHAGRLPVVRDIDATPGLQEQVFSLRPGGTVVSGRFLGLADHGVERVFAGLHVIRVSDDPRQNVVLRGATLEADGAFHVPGVPAGTWQVTLSTRERPHARLWFDVAGSGAVDLGDIDLGPVWAEGEHAFEVTVRADDGSTEDAPRVLFRHEDWPPRVWRSTELWMGHTQRVDGVRTGRYECRFSPQGHDPMAWDMTDTATFELEADASVPSVTLEIKRR